MKNIFRFLMAAAIIFGAVSCAKEDISSSLAGGEVEVTLSVDVPELGTRAFGDGMTVDQLFIAVYEKDGTVALPISHIDDTATVDFQGSEAFSGGRATVTMVLLKDKTYDLVFWAQKSGTGAYDVNLADGRNIEANYGAACNLEDRDAFFLIRKNWKAGAKDAETEFHLNRPFAQINVANSDADVAFVTANGAEIETSAMTVKTKVANVLDMKTGDVDGSVNVAFSENAIPTEAFHIAGYNYLAMNYLLVNEKDLVDLKFEFTDDKNVTYTREYGNVPVQRNYRTNILGQIISSPIDFTVVIDPIFDGAHEVTPWNGNDTKEVTPNADGVYEISEASELAWLAAAVNGTRAEGDTYAGKTFVLTQDIDLCGHNWTPIGFNGSFNGIFDGNGKTISNLVVLGYNSTVGLFGTTQNGEIKNVTIKDAKVSGRLNVGVVAGNPYTSKYTNITVKGHIEVNGMAYVGGVGGKNAYANWTNVTVNVDKDSYVRANSVENGTAYRTYVGGVVGFNGEGTHSFTNITSNVKVEGSTCDVGGLFGIAHYGNKFENCVCEGKVEIFAAEEAEEAEEIGGIAGVWNNGGQDVIMNNVEFKGNIITNVEATVWYGGLVGKPYSTTGNGKLVLNGVKFTANGADLNAINEQIAAGNFVFPFDLSGKADASNAYGATGIYQNGGVIDGNGFTLKVNNAGGTWDSAIATKGGTIKNLTVAGAFRGIFMPGANDNVYIDNVTFKNVVYTFNSDAGNKNYGVYISNSTLNGWTSHSDVHKEVVYTNCNFGKGSGYAYCRPYGPTKFVNCNFSEGYTLDPIGNIELENCKLNGVDITLANIAELAIDLSKVTVNGTSSISKAEDAATLVSSIKNAGTTTLLYPAADGKAIDTEKKLSIASGASLIGVGEEPVKVVNSWSSNAFANQAHFTNTHIENINFTNNLVIDAGIANGNVSFKNCIFGGDLAHQGVHFDSGNGVVVFDGCTFVGRNMFGSSLEKVVFNNCTFLNKKSSLTGADKWTGVNMWGKYEFNNCVFDTEAHCNVKCDGVEATFTGCSFVNGKNIEELIWNGNNYSATISFK